MDEFVHYHALGCASAPRSRELPLIRDGCGYFDLRLPLAAPPLPLRAYSYIGSLPAAPFYPFWKLLADPVAARVQGAVFFLLWAALAARLLRVRASAIVTAGLVFPVWLVTFVVDEGPVGLSALLLLLALAAARRALAAPRPGDAAAWAAGSGLALFLGLWTKLVFAWWLPAFARLRRRGGPPAGTVARDAGAAARARPPGGSPRGPAARRRAAREHGPRRPSLRGGPVAREPLGRARGRGGGGRPARPLRHGRRARGAAQPDPALVARRSPAARAERRPARGGLALERAPAGDRDLGGPLGPDLRLRGLERLQPVAPPLRVPAAAPGLRPGPRAWTGSRLAGASGW